MTLYEVSTEEKTMRICGENEGIIRGERGDLDITYNNTQHLFEMPESFKSHIEHPNDALLFTNPNLKKFAGYNIYTETSIDYNLQARQIKEFEYEEKYRNYSYELYYKLNLSIFENMPIRSLDSNCMYFCFNIS
jgi:hypothetical protein